MYMYSMARTTHLCHLLELIHLGMHLGAGLIGFDQL